MSNTRPEGMCHDCRVEPGAAKRDGTLATRCAACAVLRTQAAREARARAKAKGRCQYAGGCTARATKGRTMCAEHLSYYAARRRA